MGLRAPHIADVISTLQRIDDEASVATEIIDRRLQPGAKPGRDMLQAFIKAGLTRDELIQESMVQM